MGASGLAAATFVCRLTKTFAATWHVNIENTVRALAENLARLYSTSENFSTETDIAAVVGVRLGEQMENAIQGRFYGSSVAMHHAFAT